MSGITVFGQVDSYAASAASSYVTEHDNHYAYEPQVYQARQHCARTDPQPHLHRYQQPRSAMQEQGAAVIYRHGRDDATQIPVPTPYRSPGIGTEEYQHGVEAIHHNNRHQVQHQQHYAYDGSESQQAVSYDQSMSSSVAGSTTQSNKILAERYKTRMCRNYLVYGQCPYEVRCMFAHGEHELRTTEMNLRDGLVTEDAIRHFKRIMQYKALENAESFFSPPPPAYDETVQSNALVDTTETTATGYVDNTAMLPGKEVVRAQSAENLAQYEEQLQYIPSREPSTVGAEHQLQASGSWRKTNSSLVLTGSAGMSPTHSSGPSSCASPYQHNPYSLPVVHQEGAEVDYYTSSANDQYYTGGEHSGEDVRSTPQAPTMSHRPHPTVTYSANGNVPLTQAQAELLASIRCHCVECESYGTNPAHAMKLLHRALPGTRSAAQLPRHPQPPRYEARRFVESPAAGNVPPVYARKQLSEDLGHESSSYGEALMP